MVFERMELLKLPYITTSETYPNRNSPTDSGEEAYFSGRMKKIRSRSKVDWSFMPLMNLAGKNTIPARQKSIYFRRNNLFAIKVSPNKALHIVYGYLGMKSVANKKMSVSLSASNLMVAQSSWANRPGISYLVSLPRCLRDSQMTRAPITWKPPGKSAVTCILKIRLRESCATLFNSHQLKCLRRHAQRNSP